ncbi:MAG: response regulator [Bacteroidetes bacterium]|nr:response regulator [Bacteroidota bacterium]
MNKTKIIVVEDEVIVAKDIQRTLVKLGYDVPATAASASQAFEKIEEHKPDVVFCDIKLKGDQDGIDIANRIFQQYDIPVIFLTSYVDKTTLDRAKLTQPYGYIIKPFNEVDLQTTLEMALYKYGKDRETRMSRQQYANALERIEDAVIIIDENEYPTFLNPKAELFTGYSFSEARSLPFEKVLFIPSTNDFIFNGDRYVNNKPAKVITPVNGEHHDVVISISQIKSEKDNFLGKAYILHSMKTDIPVVEKLVNLDNLVINDSFFVKKGSQLVKVYLENILWIQAMDNYVIIQTHNDQFIIHSTMKDIEAKLPTAKFVRVHRSFIIQVDKITILDENTVIVNEKNIPIGKSYRESFLNRLKFL